MSSAGVPVSREIVIGITALISLGVFFSGRRFARMKVNPWAGKRLLGQPVEGHGLSVKQVNRIGFLQMIVAPLFFLAFVAIIVFGGVAFRG